MVILWIICPCVCMSCFVSQVRCVPLGGGGRGTIILAMFPRVCGDTVTRRWVLIKGGGGHREGEKDIRWMAGTARGGTGHLGLMHTQTQRGRLRMACGQRRVDSKNSQTTPPTTSTSPIRQSLGAADAQTAHMPHSAQPRHTNYWAPRTQKRHQQEHWPQRPTESSNPTQHVKGRTGDCPGPRKGATTRRNVTQGVIRGGVVVPAAVSAAYKQCKASPPWARQGTTTVSCFRFCPCTPQSLGLLAPGLALVRDVLERGELPPPPSLQGAQPMPSHCPRDGKCQLQWHLQPTVTAPNRFGNLFRPPISPLLGPPLRFLPF